MSSVFECMKKDMCKELMESENFVELESKLNFILNEWDLSEENQYYYDSASKRGSA